MHTVASQHRQCSRPHSMPRSNTQTYHIEFDTPFRYVRDTQDSRIEAHVKCETMSTPMSPAFTLRPAVLNCSELYLWPANLTSIHTRIRATQAKKTPKPHTMTQPATYSSQAGSVRTGASGWHALQYRTKCGCMISFACILRRDYAMLVVKSQTYAPRWRRTTASVPLSKLLQSLVRG